MKSIQKLVVSFSWGTEEQEVGELVTEGKRIYFKFYPSFLESKIEISPFKLKSTEKICLAEPVPFEGLFGVFADSLPDGWGRLLLDRSLASKGISPERLGPLDRLSYVGKNGMGALIYQPVTVSGEKLNHHPELDQIARASKRILEGASSDVLDELIELGGSSGGARPKIIVGYHHKTEKLIYGNTDLPEPYSHWLIKFRSSSDPTDIANIEFAYYKMAIEAGIEMSECRLFEGRSGNYYFGTKRFDRNYGKRFHLHSAAGLMHDDFRLSNMDYGNLMDCAFRLESHYAAYEKVLRIAAFNILAHNRDDHSKNFAFLMDQYGKWKFAPAYDLTFSNSSHGFHSTMVAGESRNPDKKDLMKLADYFKIKKAKQIIEQVEDAVAGWKKHARSAGVEKESLKRIEKIIAPGKTV